MSGTEERWCPLQLVDLMTERAHHPIDRQILTILTMTCREEGGNGKGPPDRR